MLRRHYRSYDILVFPELWVHFTYEGEGRARVCCDITAPPPRLLSDNSAFYLTVFNLTSGKMADPKEKIKQSRSCLPCMLSEVYLLLRYLSVSGVTQASGMYADIWTHHLTF